MPLRTCLSKKVEGKRTLEVGRNLEVSKLWMVWTVSPRKTFLSFTGEALGKNKVQKEST